VRMGAAMMMRVSNPYLTPARVGMILLMVLLLGAIVVRVIGASEYSDVGTPSSPENDGHVTTDTGIRGLRGSLP